MLAFALAASLFFAGAEEPVNPIAPLPVTAMRTVTRIKGKLSTSDGFNVGGFNVTQGQVCYKLKLRPSQSVMAVIEAPRASIFRITFTDNLQKPITSRAITKVGAKVALLNRLHEAMDFQVVVHGSGSMQDEPYELVLYELDTDAALAK
jgi:hypothetical protein